MPEAVVLDGLDPAQSQAVSSTAQPLCVLAGAGSGKTRVLTRRVAYRIHEGEAEAQHSLVLTFTRKAADELRSRLRRLNVDDSITIGTFHAVAYAELRRYREESGRPVPAISKRPLDILETALAKIKMDRIGNTRALLAEIAWAKTHRITPATYENALKPLRHRGPLSSNHMVRVYEAYETEKRKRGVWDFDDLLAELCALLERDRRFAAAQHWRFRHFFVDEFQDLNQAQFDLLRLWMGDRKDVFLVGDPNQAIYGWNGADATFLNEIDRYLPGVETIRLTTNYRSTQQVLAAAHSVLPPTRGAVRNTPFEDAETGDAPTLRRYPDEFIEAKGIARHVRQACAAPRSWGDAAILVRTNAQRAVIEAALESSKIPYRSAGGAGWLYRADLREAIDHLRNLGERRLVEVLPDIELMVPDLLNEAAREALEEMIVSGRERLVEDPNIKAREFLTWLEVATRFDGVSSKTGQAVTVATFHRAKGLEWPVVFLAGLEDGLVPFGNTSGAQLDEERRLFYVAITRAREELHCSFADQRTVKDKSVTQKPSPWLTFVANARIEDTGPDRNAAHETIVAGRAALHVEPVVDITDNALIRETLVKWRASRAHLTAISPQLIMSDETLDALVNRRPTSREELAEVPGLGPVKAATMATALLPLLNPPT